MADISVRPDYAKGLKSLGWSDQGGRPDAVQIMVLDGFAYIGHVFSGGFSVVDVRNPREPKFVRTYEFPGQTWSMHLQAHGDLLFVVNMRDMFKASEPVSADPVSAVGENITEAAPEYCAGMRVYDISNRAAPREIAFMPLEGLGVHRIWYDGGQWAYLSARPPGFTDDIFFVIDVANPGKPVPVSKLWLPGMNKAAGEEPSWDQKYRYALHHAIVKGDLACGAWRDGGLTTIDVSDRYNPRFLAHRNLCPPFAGGTHNTLPVPERDLLVVVEEAMEDNCLDGTKRNWVFDIREPANPVSISSMPIPSDADYLRKGGQFGPHNIHENRIGSFQSSEIFFITYQNAGLRVYDISDEFRPREVGAFVPPAPRKLMDRRPNRPLAIDTTDVYVTRDGLVFITDFNAGLHILELGDIG